METIQLRDGMRYISYIIKYGLSINISHFQHMDKRIYNSNWKVNYFYSNYYSTSYCFVKQSYEFFLSEYKSVKPNIRIQYFALNCVHSSLYFILQNSGWHHSVREHFDNGTLFFYIWNRLKRIKLRFFTYGLFYWTLSENWPDVFEKGCLSEMCESNLFRID